MQIEFFEESSAQKLGGYLKVADIMLHRIDMVVINSNIKQKYTISSGVVRV